MIGQVDLYACMLTKELLVILTTRSPSINGWSVCWDNHSTSSRCANPPEMSPPTVAVLKGASAEAHGWGDTGTYLHSLGMIHQEVFDPRADIVRLKQIAQFVFRRKMLGSGGLCGLLCSLTSAPALHPRLLLLSKRRFCFPFPGMIIHEAPGFMTKSAVRL